MVQHINASTFVSATTTRVVEGFSSLHPIMRLKACIDRRFGIRSRVSRKVSIFVGDAQFQAVVRDVSPGGLGLHDAPALEVGSEISISSIDGPIQRGTVVWSHDGRAGIKLTI